MGKNVIAQEKYGKLGPQNVYIKAEGRNSFTVLDSSRSGAATFSLENVKNFCRDAFLPQGYPDSVSDDYLNYQIWDTVQAFCSTITGTLTTQAVMKGVGVGDNTATALAATITWILKDGTGMIGRIVFAWWKGICLDVDCKKWRLVADVLNDLAMFLELCIPAMLEFSTAILCITSSMKSIVGVAGGATRAAITQHQAVRNNMGDVSAKDGSQETFVNLCASLTGIFILTTIGDIFMWPLFFTFTTLHLYANYRAVKSLKMVTLNSSRFLILLQTFLVSETVSSPALVNLRESVILGYGINDKDVCGYNIRMGKSLKHIIKEQPLPFKNFEYLSNIFQLRKYMHILDRRKRTIYVIFQKNETAEDVLEAYFYAVLYGIAACILYNKSIPILEERSCSGMSAVDRLRSDLKSGYKASSDTSYLYIATEALEAARYVVSEQFRKFIDAVQAEGWKTNVHQLNVDEWRCSWQDFNTTKQKVK